MTSFGREPGRTNKDRKGAELSFPLSLPALVLPLELETNYISFAFLIPSVVRARKTEFGAGHRHVDLHEAPSLAETHRYKYKSDRVSGRIPSDNMSTVPFTVVPVIDLNNTVGALEIGVQVSTFLFGILSCQSTVFCLSISRL